MKPRDPWLNRFPSQLSDQQIKDLVRLCPPTLTELGNQSPEVDAARLRSAMEGVFEPTDPIVEHLRHFIGLGEAHAAVYFSSQVSHNRRLYDNMPATPPGTCLTGLAGTGKTALIRAFSRLVAAYARTEENLRSLPQLDPCWIVEPKQGENLKECLREIAYKDAAEAGTDGTVASFAAAASRRARRRGVCLLFMDEMQWETLSSGANTRVTAKLLLFRQFGPHFVFCLNFSMAHKLTRRNQEDRDRLLSDPIVVLPELRGTSGWQSTVSAIVSVAPDAFDEEVKVAYVILHLYTFGIKRKLVSLLEGSYLLARRSERLVTTLEDVKAAYASSRYAGHRNDVEILLANEISESKRPSDLVCPFRMSAKQEGEVADAAEQYAAQLKAANSRQAVISSMTGSERANVNDSNATAVPPTKAAKPTRMPRASKQQLAANAKDYFQ